MLNKLTDYLQTLDDPRKESIIKFHEDHLSLMLETKGSNSNHQAWKGGYLDHIQESLNIADIIYSARIWYNTAKT